MSKRVFIGQYLPKTNVHCFVTNKIVGPTQRQKFAYTVQCRDEEKFRSYSVANKQDAINLRDKFLAGELD